MSSPTYAIETERLRLREATLDDADLALQIYNSPGFIEFVGDRGLRTTDDAKAYLEKNLLGSYAKNGFGLYIVELKASGEPVGMCGLVDRPGLDAPDIGFTFLPDHMRMGYGYESAAAVLDYGRNKLGMTRILAIVDPKNAKSIGLIEKLGMVFDRKIQLPGDDERISQYTTI
ncbi:MULTISPECIES: GNAT family N-acetyltransferase [Kordiimonas]|jgi:RimJ/RimL family protein N-acetyltransferase|uniref:GNAT family N-acetyltransferase n=1 Tax=Kordiimonas TaxID=288021 RepID=UPI00257DC668|nr:GNAT family N-acetyltransferase [Kordiimonas sp. UBA4487]